MTEAVHDRKVPLADMETNASNARCACCVCCVCRREGPHEG